VFANVAALPENEHWTPCKVVKTLTNHLAQQMLQECVRLEGEFSERIDESRALAYHVTLPILRNREDAEDIAQDALVKAYLALGTLRREECFLAWIACIAKRLALNRLRAEKRWERHREVSWRSDSLPSVIEKFLEQERSERLWAAINALPEKFRGLLILVSIEERSVAEAATILNIPEGTVKSRLLRARTRLKNLLSEPLPGT
jgi:RNA polymerase sigma-70 factor (ECF subfamily)